MEDKNTIKLPEEVAKLYKPAPHAVREMALHALGRVDLNKINLKQAAKLAEAKALIPIEKQPKEKEAKS